MKVSSILVLTSLLFIIAAKADQSASYPEDKPLIDLTFPDDWEVKTKKGTLFGNPKGDGSLFLSLAPMEAGSGEIEVAIKEAKDSIEESFKNVQYDEPLKSVTDGVEMLLLNATGEDEDGKASINIAIIGQPGEKTLLELECISSAEGATKHGEALTKVFHSIKAHSNEAAVQTYSYPDKENPSFAIDFPADWKLEADAEGAYVESPDKLVAMNVLFIDMADLGVAAESMKEKVDAKYESIEWNGGGEPSVKKDDALDLTATFNNALAMDGDVKYSVNFAQYAKKGGDKFLLLIGQEPLKALDKHGDAIEKILQSIKVK